MRRKKAKKALRVLFRTVGVLFIVLCLYLASLFFRVERVPASWVNAALASRLPTNVLVRVDALAFGFRHGLSVEGLKVYDRTSKAALEPIATAAKIVIHPLERRVWADRLVYVRLPDGYYAPGNHERNERLECVFPEIEPVSLTLERSNILGVAPRRLTTDVTVTPTRFTADHIRIDWPDEDEKMFLDGFCYVDIDRQEVYGEVNGSARQHHIRPLLVTLDVPVSLPYMDGFTEVPGKVPSWCGWRVNLVNNDFDLYLKLHPTMGKYNGVPMTKADGSLHLHIYTRGESLNYRQTIGPIAARGVKDQPLAGTVVVTGTNGYNVVDVDAKSALPVADLLRIGGFTGEYVGEEVVGDSTCRLQFRFPRAMTNNYEALDGYGHLSIRNGQVLRMKGFRGLVALMAEKVPGISYLTDSTEASCDYVIEKGVLKSDNIYIEGSVFSIKMYGSFDATSGKMDFTARVQFTKKDSWMGKILHPLTWPFTKLLLEFRMTGTPENPEWKYISVIDRVVEAVQ